MSPQPPARDIVGARDEIHRPLRQPGEAPLAIDADEFRRLAHELADRVADLLASVPDGPVTAGEPPDAVRAVLRADAALPEHGTDPSTLLREAGTLLGRYSLFNGHPRFFGYITSSPAPIGILADFLASAVNPNVGAWTLSPLASEIEAQTVRWIAELIGYPRECGGLLVSGGNMANFVGLLAARAALAGGDLRRKGLAGAPGPLHVYASAETHTWIQKATDLSGLGTDAIQWIPTDGALRMDVAALRARLADDVAGGVRPLMVVGTAGSVSTGAVDPLDEIAAACREFGVWFHVDGAYGGFAAAVPGAAPALAALREADSVAIDPHKWLYAPLEAGCALVRRPEALRETFAYHPPYYHFGQQATNFVDFGPQNSRGFRALKVWLALRQVGRAGYVRMIGDDIGLSEHLAACVREHPELQAATQALSITTFRYVPADLRPRLGAEAVEAHLDALNRELLARLERSGAAFVSNAIVGGRFLLRACIVNFNTAAGDVEALPGIVAQVGRQVDGELRARAQGI